MTLMATGNMFTVLSGEGSGKKRGRVTEVLICTSGLVKIHCCYLLSSHIFLKLCK